MSLLKILTSGFVLGLEHYTNFYEYFAPRRNCYVISIVQKMQKTIEI